MSFLKRLKSTRHLFNKSVETSSTTTNQHSTLNNSNLGNKHVNLRTLIIFHIDSETEGHFLLNVDNEDTGQLALDLTCEHYDLNDYKEFFGLKYTLLDEKGDHEIFWLDPFKVIGKQLKDSNNVLMFRVKHFPSKPELIESEHVRYLMFLQIRNHFLKGDYLLTLVDENRLAAYAIQAALGDYDPDIHKEGYLRLLKFLPIKTVKTEETIIEMHKQLKGKTPAQMELAFLEKVSQMDTYGAEMIIVKNSKGVPLNFGVSHNGIITYLHFPQTEIPKIGLYPWTKIGTVSYRGRTLRIHTHTPTDRNSEIIKKRVMEFKCKSERICKHLWKFILEQKSFYNFKESVQVPKFESSNNLFFRKSKFRFSGRCESELIASQSSSLYSSSHTMMDSTGNSTQDINANKSIQPNLFKRNTFLHVERVMVTRSPTNELERHDGFDSNNNNIKMVKKILKKAAAKPNENEESKKEVKTSENPDAPANFSLASSVNDQSSGTLIVNQSGLSLSPNDFDLSEKHTSTPNINQSHQSGDKTIESIKESDNENESANDQVTKEYQSALTDSTKLSDVRNEEFLDVQDETSDLTSSVTLSQSNLGASAQVGKPKRSFKFGLIMSIVLVSLGSYAIMLYFDCNKTKSENINLKMNQCNTYSIMSMFKNNFNLFLQSSANTFVSYTSKLGILKTSLNRLVPWPVSNDTINKTSDPLFSWFFNYYRPNQ